VRVRSAEEGALEAWARGAVPAFLRTAVKAATLHRACVERAPRGLHARVVLDV
jgi:SHS2 domain-containing protein